MDPNWWVYYYSIPQVTHEVGLAYLYTMIVVSVVCVDARLLEFIAHQNKKYFRINLWCYS